MGVPQALGPGRWLRWRFSGFPAFAGMPVGLAGDGGGGRRSCRFAGAATAPRPQSVVPAQAGTRGVACPGVVGCPGRGGCGGRGFLDSGLRRNDDQVGLRGRWWWAAVVQVRRRRVDGPAFGRRTVRVDGRYPGVLMQAGGWGHGLRRMRLSPSYRRLTVPVSGRRVDAVHGDAARPGRCGPGRGGLVVVVFWIPAFAGMTIGGACGGGGGGRRSCRFADAATARRPSPSYQAESGGWASPRRVDGLVEGTGCGLPRAFAGCPAVVKWWSWFSGFRPSPE